MRATRVACFCMVDEEIEVSPGSSPQAFCEGSETQLTPQGLSGGTGIDVIFAHGWCGDRADLLSRRSRITSTRTLRHMILTGLATMSPTFPFGYYRQFFELFGILTSDFKANAALSNRFVTTSCRSLFSVVLHPEKGIIRDGACTVSHRSHTIPVIRTVSQKSLEETRLSSIDAIPLSTQIL